MNDDQKELIETMETPPAGPAEPEQAPPPDGPPKKKQRRLTGSTAAKAAAFILTVLMAALCAACVIGIVVFWNMRVYTLPKDAFIAREIAGGLDQYTYAQAMRVVDLMYALRYPVYPVGIAALILTVVCFVFLLCASGHHKGADQVRPGWGTAVPLDLLTALMVFTDIMLVALVLEGTYYGGSAGTIAAICGAALLGLILLLGWAMSFALRMKLGGWWKNTLVYRALALLWRFLKWLFQTGLPGLWRGLKAACRWLLRPVKAIGHGIAALIEGIPLIWKTALGTVLLAGVELMFHLELWWEPDVLLVLWMLEKLVIVSLIFYFALTMRRLQKAGQALAAGDLSHQVDTRQMLWSFKAHGENLNSIALGMNRAVEQRLRSERLKTELITNVSHDIKTPLTSIINYADLIAKEQCENEAVTEYAAVLLRQSERLKKLIDDLVEASKASTGNLEMLLAPCEAGVLLTQAAGEYQPRFAAAQLEPVVRQPDHPVLILADGRRLWRVFDNLLSNICKYAQAHTRVYLTLEERDGEVLISFKNTSREPLDLPPEELLERFSRGDGARTSEGNGLGLSIAQSLTELQKGKLELTVDGDLFKVVLRFPTAGS